MNEGGGYLPDDLLMAIGDASRISIKSNKYQTYK